MLKTLTIGASIVDIYVRSNDFNLKNQDGGRWLCHAYGAKLNVDETKLTSGGGASNVAVGLSRLGFESRIISEIGHDNLGEIVKKDLLLDDVNIDLLVEERLENTGVSVILVGADGERTVMVDRGASGMLNDYDIPVAQIANQDWVHISSLNGQKETMQKILHSLRVCCTGFSWNPGGKEIEFLVKGELELEVLPEQKAIFFVNREEWQALAGRQDEINNKFNLVVVTAGRGGGWVYQYGVEKWYYHSGHNAPFDTTGAGDAFATGFIAAHLKGANIELSCEWGRHNGSNVVRYYGAKQGLLTADQMDRILRNEKLVARIKKEKNHRRLLQEAKTIRLLGEKPTALK